MGEKQKLIGKTFSYEGIFVFKHVFYEMDSWLREHWYDKFEKWNEEQNLPDGTKQMRFEFVPWKKYTDYYKGRLKIELMASKVKEVEIEMDGAKVKAQQGKLDVKFTGYLIVDYEWFYGSRWNTPLLYFMRDLFDRFANYRYTIKYRRMVVDHVNELSSVMMNAVNLTQYKLPSGAAVEKKGRY